MTDGLGIGDAEPTTTRVHTSVQAARLPDELRLGPVRLQVSDLARSSAFYSGVLGLRVVDRAGESAMLATEDGATPLVHLTERTGSRAVQPHSRLGLYHFALLLPDRAALGRLLGHLAEIGTRIGASDHLVSEAIYLHDPDGLGIEVYADRPRSAWKRSAGEIEMATVPLDTASVLDAANGAPWTGMPDGSTMGHLHLHVPDLEVATGFYHEVLGLDRTVWSYPGALFLSAGGYHHHLGLNTWAGARAPAPSERDAQLLEWSMILPGADEAQTAISRLSAAGHTVTESEGGWTVSDPWGTRLRLASA